MLFTLIIKTSHLQNNFNALELARCLVLQNQNINCIFFIFDGVYTANAAIDLPSDEPNLAYAWNKFALDNNLTLTVCSASAARRGITADKIYSGFTLGSIGQLVEYSDQADRVITL